MFGADVSLQGQEEALTAAPRDAAPVPAASAVGQGPGTGHVALATAAAPVHHHIGDGDPPWLAGLRQSLLGDMREMRADQKEILTSVQEQRAEFRHMGQRLERVEGRQDDLRHRLDSMEKELREVRSRSASPIHTPRHAGFRFRFRPSESADEDYDPIRTWGIKNTRSSRFVTVQLGQTR